MRKGTYRPEVGCLEERTLLSGTKGVSARPVVLPRLRFIHVAEHMEAKFSAVATGRSSFSVLRSKLRDDLAMIPFGRVDGLGASINRILDRLRSDRAAGVPDAIRIASDEAIAETRAVVETRVRAGDVVVR